MRVRITKAFRRREADGVQRSYAIGDVAVGETAAWAVREGFGEPELERAKATAPARNKATRPAANRVRRT